MDRGGQRFLRIDEPGLGLGQGSGQRRCVQSGEVPHLIMAEPPRPRVWVSRSFDALRLRRLDVCLVSRADRRADSAASE
jgi:hypothetical protein